MDWRFGIVAVAGALGAVARYGVARVFPADVVAGEFPTSTLIVNVVGSFFFGIITGLGNQIPEWLRIALLAGVLGAFTTFSTFAYESLALWINGRQGLAVAQVGLQIVLAFALVLLGLWIGRSYQA